MTIALRAFLLVGLLAAPFSVAAQDQSGTAEAEPTTEETAPAETPATDAPAEEGAETSDTDLGLSMGEPGDVAQVGQTYVRSTHTDWELRCVKAEDGNDPCQLYQLLRDAQGTAVAEINLFNLPEGQEAVAGANVVTPLETLLTAQLRLTVDGREPRRYPYSFCAQYAATQYGCFARLGFTGAEIDQFKRGSSATVTIVPVAAPRDEVELTMSLAGFTAGWDALVAANSR